MAKAAASLLLVVLLVGTISLIFSKDPAAVLVQKPVAAAQSTASSVSAGSASAGSAASIQGSGQGSSSHHVSSESTTSSHPNASEKAQLPMAITGCLLVGLVGMTAGAIAFLIMALRTETETLFHHLTFIVASISAVAYYSMWMGFGIEVIPATAHHAPRFIFWARYLDWFFTTPLILICLALLAQSTRGTVVSLVGSDALMIVCWYLGGGASPVQKYSWWCAGVLFFLIVLHQLFVQIQQAKTSHGASGAMVLRHLTYLTAITWCTYPTVWLFGDDGLHLLPLAVQASLITVADLISKVGFGFYLILHREEVQHHSGYQFVDGPAKVPGVV